MPFRDSKHILKVWLANARASLVREMEFRSNFMLGIFRQSLWLLAFIFLIEVIFQNTSSLAGWDRFGVLTVLALSRMIEGLINILFADNILSITELVQHGTFDFMLIKPLPTQFATFFRRLSFHEIGNVLAGIALLSYVFFNNGAIFSVSHTLLAFLLAALGITIYYSLLLLIASLVFYVERLEALWSFNHLFSEPLTVPFDIFPRGPRMALTYLIPLAFVVFVPAQVITGRLGWWQLPVAVGLAVIFLLLANLAWRAGLRRYSSASS